MIPYTSLCCYNLQAHISYTRDKSILQYKMQCNTIQECKECNTIQETKTFIMLGEVGMANESTKTHKQVCGWLNTMNEQGCITYVNSTHTHAHKHKHTKYLNLKKNYYPSHTVRSYCLTDNGNVLSLSFYAHRNDTFFYSITRTTYIVTSSSKTRQRN